MRGRRVLKASLRSISPVFCAGAVQNEAAEIRPFSIRGVLRWWYRAVDRDYATREADFFGATGRRPCSSPVSLRLGRWVSGDKDYSAVLGPTRALARGAAYLGYTLYLRKNQRRAVPENTAIQLELVNERGDEAAMRAWAASLWLFGHLGGLGSRARRGFGTLALESWEGWPQCDELSPAHGASSPGEWKERFTKGFARIRKWFKPCENATHHHLGASLELRIWRKGFASWADALDAAGTALRTFRAEPRNHRPELLAAFGLPIRFRGHEARFAKPAGFNRAPSRLQFRVVRIGAGYHPMAWRALGSLMPGKAELVYNGRHGAKTPDDRLLDEFFRYIDRDCI